MSTTVNVNKFSKRKWRDSHPSSFFASLFFFFSFYLKCTSSLSCYGVFRQSARLSFIDNLVKSLIWIVAWIYEQNLIRNRIIRNNSFFLIEILVMWLLAIGVIDRLCVNNESISFGICNRYWKVSTIPPEMNILNKFLVKRVIVYRRKQRKILPRKTSHKWKI